MAKIADILLFFAGLLSAVAGVYLLRGLPVALVVLGCVLIAASLYPNGSRYKPPRGGA